MLKGWLLGGVLWSSCTPAVVSTDQQVPTPSSNPYWASFFEGTARACSAWQYVVDLDTAQLVLLHGHKRTFADLAVQAPTSFHMLTNAGMFHRSGAPVGLFWNGMDAFPLNTEQDKRGNFFLQPNGVFYVDTTGQPGILTTADFQNQYPNPQLLQLATQSGPMLLIDGQYHPALGPNSSSCYIRNGVGLKPDQTVVFLCTVEPTNLHTFASLFLELGCQNALYLDGAISGMYIEGATAELEAFDTPYGPVLGIVVD